MQARVHVRRQQIATHKAELAAGREDEAKLEGATRETRERAGALRADVNGSAQKVRDGTDGSSSAQRGV